MNRKLSIAGFLILTIVVLLLYGFTMYHTWVVRSFGEIWIILIVAGLLFGIYQEGSALSSIKDHEFSMPVALKNVAGVVSGAILAYTISVSIGLGAVLAASLVALIASLVLPKYGVPIYCGSFVGMTSSRLLVNHTELAFAAIVAGILFVLVTQAFNGFGGKLGTVAFAATLITQLGLKREFIITAVPDWELIFPIVLLCTLATITTFWLSVHLKHGAVVASGIVGITGGLILPAVYQGNTGSTLAVMVMCASFAGMSTKEKYPHIFQMAVVGLLTGIVFIYSMPLAGGAGGKLGCIAFGASVAVRGLIDLLKRLPIFRGSTS